MKTFASNIPTSLGDLINIKSHLDSVKSQYSKIDLTFHTDLWGGTLYLNDVSRVAWMKYINDIGQLFFSGEPYSLNRGQYPFRLTSQIIKELNIPVIKPELGHILCKGQSLDIGPYIVITTKVRGVSKFPFLEDSIQLWAVLKKLSPKYKIVILGEKEVEMRKEYEPLKGQIFGIYEQIISNIPSDQILDLTVSGLGNTPSDMSQVQQDCLIMKEAQVCITIGQGGNLCMSTAVANMAVGYRSDNDWLAEAIYNRIHPNAIVTKNWGQFISTLGRYQ